MTIYLSDQLINSIQKDVKKTFSSAERAAMQKTIRDYFIRVHNEAVESTVMACNRKVYKTPEFYDK